MNAPQDPKKKPSGKSPPSTATAPGSPERAALSPTDSPAAASIPAKRPAASFPIVAIGASAGGLKALEGFFAGLPADCGMAFVVVQHLDPRRESLLPSLLANYTPLPVLEARQGTALAAGKVYVKTPGRDLVVRGGVLNLQEAAEHPAALHAIDVFMRSLADDQGEHAIAVILSGTGSDGALGVREVHAAGGLVVVQQEAQAEYDGMPCSAIDTGMVDFVLPVEKMGEELQRYCGHPLVTRRELKRELAEGRTGQELLSILGLLRAQTGHDFTQYKRNTIRRRIGRRLAIHKLERLADYTALLRQNPAEAQALFKDLLINVTSFFRDPEAFAALGEELVRLLAVRESEEPVRVWVPGCATGEEAYTVAILLQEAMEKLEKSFAVKIFATDLNAQAVETGREGVYPDSIAVDVSERRLKRHFIHQGGQYRVDGRLREMIVFAVHDLTRDPPFSRLDLVCCRNLLIYLDARLQKRIIPLLRYSLRPGGLLLLGTSEDVGEFGELFVPVQRKWKLFRVQEGTASSLPYREFNMAPAARPRSPAVAMTSTAEPSRYQRSRETALRNLMETSLMDEFTPPGVLLDDRDEIVFFHGETAPYLAPPRGEPTLQIARLVRGDLAEALPELIERARRLGERVGREGLRLPTAAGSLRVDVAVKPLPAAGPGHLRITFRSQEPTAEPGKSETDDDLRVAALQRELFATRQDLQATIEELETANEELQSANEELQANNEELQSANEELDTSREELQSTNEELETVNAELKMKNDDLQQVNNDVNNLFTATDIGTVILDTKLCLKRYTPAATRFFRLIPSDLGRPVTDLATTLIEEGLWEDARQVWESLRPREREIASRDGRIYATHILPYLTGSNGVAGAILTFTDVTRLKEAEQSAAEARLFAESILDTLREPFLVLDAGLRTVTANRAFYRTFRVSREETEQVPLFELGNGQWDIPELRRLLLEIIPQNSRFDDFRVSHDFPGLGRRTMLLNARRIDREEGKPKLILLAFEDVSGREGPCHER